MTCVMQEKDGKFDVGVLQTDQFGELDGTIWLSSFDDKAKAADYVHWLNGGSSESESARCTRALESVAERLDRIWRTIGRLR